MYNFILVGAGALGSRHLQSLVLVSKFKRVQRIYVVDLDKKALGIAQERAEEVLKQIPEDQRPVVTYHVSLSNLSVESADLCIVASSSRPRRVIIENLLNKFSIKRMILEKFLFTNFDDYKAIRGLLREKDVSSWVNCPRPCSEGYQWVKDALTGMQHLEMSVSGSMLHLLSNSIHHLELYRFLTDDPTLSFNFSGSGGFGDIKPAKREGYFDSQGSLQCVSARGNLMLLSSHSGSLEPLVCLTTDTGIRISIREAKGAVFLEGPDGDIQERSLNLRHISQLAENYAQLLEGKTPLPTFENSAKLHLDFMTFLEPILRPYADDGAQIPIT